MSGTQIKLQTQTYREICANGNVHREEAAPRKTIKMIKHTSEKNILYLSMTNEEENQRMSAKVRRSQSSGDVIRLFFAFRFIFFVDAC